MSGSGGGGRGPLVALVVGVAVLLVGGLGVGLLVSTSDDAPVPVVDVTEVAVDDETVARDPESPPPDADPSAEVVDVFDVGVGDCFDDDALGESAEVSNVALVPCDSPHDNEVFAVFDMPDGPWPGQEAVDVAIDDGCLPRFETFVGIDYESSRYVSTSLFPTEGSWEGGDREIVCFLYDIDFAKLMGSAAGTAE